MLCLLYKLGVQCAQTGTERFDKIFGVRKCLCVKIRLAREFG